MPVCYKVKEISLKRDEECKKIAKEASVKAIPGRPIVLSQKRFNILKEHADKDRALREQEEKRAERERMNALTEALTSKRTPEQKIAEFKKQLEEKTEKAKASLNVSKEFYEGLRREKIAKAELLVQQLKSGPRNLRSAAMQSEMFRARDVQVEVNQLIQNSIKKQELADKASCEQQSIFYLGEGQETAEEKQEIEKAYRAEMLQLIRDNECNRAKNKMKLLEEERQERAQIDAEIRAQIEKERQAIEKKRCILRKNAIEAMKMAEERKKRETIYDDVEDRLCCVYNTGRRELERLKSEQDKEFALERQKQIEKNTLMLKRIQDQIRNNEAERIGRDINTMKLKFDAQEQEKRNREKELKRQRIEAHLKEMEECRLAKERACEVRRYEVAQRFKNSEVNARFYDADRLQQQQRAKCVRAQLMAQEEERQRILREREIKNRTCDDKRFEKEDNFFFKYAYTLMEDANKKQRPLYPFKRVIKEYKQSNMRDMEQRKIPRHMVTSLCVQPDKDRDEEYAEARTTTLPKEIGKKTEKPTSPISKVKAETLEHMAKIEALFAEDERRRADKSAKSCIPYDCTVSPCQQTDEEKKDGLQPPNDEDSACGKVRYGIEELKNLSTAAPSLH